MKMVVFINLIIYKLKKIKQMKKIFYVVIAAVFLTSCVAVKEYEKVNINDPDMVLSSRKSNKFETAFQAYRESAAGANGGKTGGGCGCN